MRACVCACVHVYIFLPTLCFLEDKSSHCVQCICMPAQSCICMYLHRDGGKPPGISLGNLAFQNTLRFKCFSNTVVYNFNQSVDSLAGFSRRSLKLQSLVHQTDCIPPSWSILLFFFYHRPSIPKPAVIPTVRGCCLTVPDLWNDDRGARAPYPSVFITLFCPPPPFTTTTTTTTSRMRDWALVVVTLTVTDVPGRTGLETPSQLISALASTCRPGLWARPPQVRGQRVMEGSVTERRRGKRGEGECWSAQRKFTKSSFNILSRLCFLSVPLF